jgi:hypothetical protein
MKGMVDSVCGECRVMLEVNGMLLEYAGFVVLRNCECRMMRGWMERSGMDGGMMFS